MFATGVILVDDGTAADMQQEALTLLKSGPPPWSNQDVQFARFVITNHLLDLQGNLDRIATMFAVHELASTLHELVLRTNGYWIGKGKRTVPALAAFDPTLPQLFADTFERFFRDGDTAEVIEFVDRLLEPYGGRLFEGYSSKH